MEKNNCWEREEVINELTKGRELMLQLQKHLKQDVCQYLAPEILSSYDKALSLLNGTALSGIISNAKEISNPTPSSSAIHLESPHLLVDKSSDTPSNSKKRKKMERRIVYAQVRSGEEVPPEDGYSWRKYGKNPVFGAKYPREYYRCKRRYLSNCAATKMVQRSEKDPSFFEILYRGSHCCDQEIKNQNEELLAVQTQSDEVGRRGENIPEMVSTPNNSFNNSLTGIAIQHHQF